MPARGFAEKVRLSGVDTLEVSRPRCEAKRIAGLRAKERLASPIRGPSVEIVRGQDRPLRPDARDPAGAGRQGRDGPATEGLAVADRPGLRAWEERADHWCQPDRG